MWQDLCRDRNTMTSQNRVIEETHYASEIKPISKINSGTFAQNYVKNIKMAYTHDWIFSGIIEKIIVFGSVAWTFFSIGKFLFNLIVQKGV